MSTGETVAALADKLARHIDGWNTATITRIAERVREIGEMSVADVASLNSAALISRDLNAIYEELGVAAGITARQAADIYTEALEAAHLENNPLYNYRGIVFGALEDDRRAVAIVNGYARVTAQTMLNLSQTGATAIGIKIPSKGFVPLSTAYADIIDKAVVTVATGAGDFHSAMRDTIRLLGGDGMQVNYGGSYSRRIDTSVRQNIMWGAKQATNEYQRMVGEELSCDGIEIDYHANPRPSHEFMQGKQFSLNGDTVIDGELYPSADDALAALEDYNCYHYATPIILGVSVPRYDKEELAALREQDAALREVEYTDSNGNTITTRKTGYEWSQDMRRLETAIRYAKGERLALDKSGDFSETAKLTQRINRMQKRYDEIAAGANIPRDPTRLTLTRPSRRR